MLSAKTLFPSEQERAEKLYVAEIYGRESLSQDSILTQGPRRDTGDEGSPRKIRGGTLGERQPSNRLEVARARLETSPRSTRAATSTGSRTVARANRSTSTRRRWLTRIAVNDFSRTIYAERLGTDYRRCAAASGQPRTPEQDRREHWRIRVIKQQAIALLRNRAFAYPDALSTARSNNVARINARFPKKT